MKKSSFFKITAALVAVAMMAACDKGDKPPKDDDDEDPIEIPSDITIDGTFADWTASSNVKTMTGVGGEAVSGKYYTNGTDLYIYMKANKAVTDGGWQELRIYFDMDNDPLTGTDVGYRLGTDENASGMDKMLNLDIAGESGLNNPIGAGNGTAYQRSKIEDYFEDEPGTEGISGASIIQSVHGIGAINGEYYEVEVKMTMETLFWTVPSPVRLAVEFQAGWNSAGWAPSFSWDWKK